MHFQSTTIPTQENLPLYSICPNVVIVEVLGFGTCVFAGRCQHFGDSMFLHDNHHENLKSHPNVILLFVSWYPV
jgi:hypothetical protein